MKYAGLLLLSSILILMHSCGIHMAVPAEAAEPVIVYKTKKDYHDRVMVQLSADGTTITAYPGPSDVLHQKPVQLAEGYWLKRMVGNAFLSLTIDEYAGQRRRYSAEELIELVVDRDPYLKIYDCGACTVSDTASINELIRAGRLKECKALK